MRTALWLLALMLVLTSMPGLASQVLPSPASCATCATCVAPCPAPAPTCAVPAPTCVAPNPCPAPVAVCPTPVPLGMPVACPTSFDLSPFLQAEVNEVAMLSAQANSLRQSGNVLGADLIASFIPDHQMQVARLQCAMGNAAMAIQPTGQPFLGSQQDIINNNLQSHAQAIQMYRALLQMSVGNPGLHQIALEGLNAASRHFDSLTVAAAGPDSPQALMAALTLEKAAVADLSTQAQQLLALGDSCNACLLMTGVSAHQQQVARLSALVAQAGGDPNMAVPPLAAPLNSAPEIMAAQRITGVQLANTYALPIASASGPVRDAALAGQQLALAGLSVTGVNGPIAGGVAVPLASTFVPIAGGPTMAPTASAAVPAY